MLVLGFTFATGREKKSDEEAQETELPTIEVVPSPNNLPQPTALDEPYEIIPNYPGGLQ